MTSNLNQYQITESGPVDETVTELTQPEAPSRQLATIQQITAIDPILGADSIDVATVKGWKVVVRKGEFQVGEPCVYFEIDSFLPLDDPRFEFLRPRGVRTQNGIEGHVLRTAKLRKQVSQGLILPTSQFPELADPEYHDEWTYRIGADVTVELGITKWDPPVPADMAGDVYGLRPAWIPKTDAERIQNIPDLSQLGNPADWYATQKLDGTSISYYIDLTRSTEERHGITSRNLDLKPSNKTPWTWGRQNAVWANLEKIRAAHNATRIVAQGEFVGPGIQKNPLRIHQPHWYCFRILIDGQEGFVSSLPPLYRIPGIPYLDLPSTVDEALEAADTLTKENKNKIEGIVWRYYGDEDLPVRCIKAISNRYLLKHED